MMKKILYHGSFATLGFSLLLGMAVLQANGRKMTQDLMGSEDSTSGLSTYVPTNDATLKSDTVSTEPVKATAPTTSSIASAPASDSGQVDPKPMKMAQKTPSPALRKVRESMNDASLQNAKAFSIFDSSRKAATKKTFGTSPNGMRNAQSYYQQLAKHSKKNTTIKAEVDDGVWVTVSASAFKKYVNSLND